MDDALWIAVLATATGTFLMRVVPLLWMKALARRKNQNTIETVPGWLSVLGPAMIAALLGASLTPATFTWRDSLATFLGVLVTLLVWRQTRSIGLPVFLGVLIYGLAKVLSF